MPERRYYGTDSTDEFDTLVQVTERPDGTLHYEFVVVDKRDEPAD